MDIKRKDLKEKWYKFNDDTKFKVRPFPFSQHKSMDPMGMALEQFLYCLVDWDGWNEEGKKIKVTEGEKTYIYDWHPDVRDFILRSSGVFAEEVGEELKN